MLISDDIKQLIEENKITDKLNKIKDKSFDFIKKHPKILIPPIVAAIAAKKAYRLNQYKELSNTIKDIHPLNLPIRDHVNKYLSNQANIENLSKNPDIPKLTQTISNHLDYHLNPDIPKLTQTISKHLDYHLDPETISKYSFKLANYLNNK
jgi:hypothetical protein